MSKSILDVGVIPAMQSVAWDVKAFNDRGGVYEWSKEEIGIHRDSCGSGMAKNVDW